MYLVLASIAVAAFVVYTVFNVMYLIDLTKTSRTVRVFIERTEQNLIPALAEMRIAIQDVRKVAGDVSLVTDRLRAAVETIVMIERNIVDWYDRYRTSASANATALKAALFAGIVTFIKNLKSGSEKSS